MMSDDSPSKGPLPCVRVSSAGDARKRSSESARLASVLPTISAWIGYAPDWSVWSISEPDVISKVASSSRFSSTWSSSLASWACSSNLFDADFLRATPLPSAILGKR